VFLFLFLLRKSASSASMPMWRTTGRIWILTCPFNSRFRGTPLSVPRNSPSQLPASSTSSAPSHPAQHLLNTTHSPVHRHSQHPSWLPHDSASSTAPSAHHDNLQPPSPPSPSTNLLHRFLQTEDINNRQSNSTHSRTHHPRPHPL